MKAMIAAVAIALSLAFATNSAYAGRVANTAIGTLAGLVVFGPVGQWRALQWDILPATVLHALGVISTGPHAASEGPAKR